MAALHSNGQAIMFYSCDLFIYYYLFFALLSSRPKNAAPRPMPGYGNVVSFYNAVQRGPYLYPVHFEGAKICKSCTTVGRWCDFELV